MPELGDLSNLFTASVPNLDWLDVDENAYRAAERLPKQNLDIKSDLEDLWSNHEKGPTFFVPNIDLSAFPEVKPTRSASAHVALVVGHLKDRMMAGWDGARLSAWAKEHVDPQLLAACLPEIRKLAAEQGLLGPVYLDATHWSKCDQGEGEKIAKKARTAKFVLANKDKCQGCVFKEGNVCAKFRKELVFEAVPYTDKMVGEYAALLKTNAPVVSSGDPRARIQSLFLGRTVVAAVDPALGGKPLVGAQEKRDRRGAQFYEPPSTNFTKAADRSLYRDLAQKMMAAKGRLSDVVKARFAAAVGNDALSTLHGEENLLGNVYVRPDQFDTCHQANDSFRRHRNAAPYIIEIPNKCQKCSFYRSGNCSLMGKKVVAEVPYTSELLANKLKYLVGNELLTQKAADKFIARAGSGESVHDLIQEAEGTYTPTAARTYAAKYEVSERGSAVSGKEAADSPNDVPTHQRSVVTAAYAGMYSGQSGLALKDTLIGKYGRDAVVAAAPSLAPILRLAGVLGTEVLDLRGFKTTEKAKVYLATKGYTPKYILKEGCCGECGTPSCAPACPSHQFPTLTPMAMDDLDALPTERVLASIDRLVMAKRISTKTASDLKSWVGTESTLTLLTAAYQARPADAGRRVYDATFKVAEMGDVTRTPDREVKAHLPTEIGPVVRDAYKAAYSGQTPAAILSMIGDKYGDKAAASEHLEDVTHLAGVLGTEVLDLRGFKNKTDAREYLTATGHRPKYILKEGGCGGCGTPACRLSCPVRGFPEMRPIDASDLDSISSDSVLSSIRYLEREGRISATTSYDLQLKIGTVSSLALLKEAHFAPRAKPVVARQDKIKAVTPQRVSTTITATMRESFKRQVRMAMNRGLHGDGLKRWLRNSFDTALVKTEAASLAASLKDQGLLGGYYIDPRPYTACEAGAREVTNAPAEYVQAMSKCQGCVYRNANSRCSIYGRTVVEAMPYPDSREATQNEILNPVQIETETLASVDVNPVQEYGLGGGDMNVSVDQARQADALEIGYDEILGDLS